MSIVGQCQVLEINRSSLYFKPKGESVLNLKLMRLIDEKFLDCPFYGVTRRYGLHHQREAYLEVVSSNGFADNFSEKEFE